MNNPMSVFVGVDFDCEFRNSLDRVNQIDYLKRVSVLWEEPYSYIGDEVGARIMCRPRLNKAQVLDDYTPILVDGFLWEHESLTKSRALIRGYCDCNLLRDITEKDDFLGWRILFISFIGVEENKGLDEWARANDVPIYNSDMEVIA